VRGWVASEEDVNVGYARLHAKAFLGENECR
jgi:hypothetical protein